MGWQKCSGIKRSYLEDYKLKGELNDLYHQDALDYDN